MKIKTKKAKFIKTALFLGIVLMAAIFLLPNFCYAQETVETLEEVGEAAEVATEEPLGVIIGRIIRVVIGFMGVVLLGIIIYAGWLWMTAGGDAEQIEKAKKWITNGIIGLIIMLFAFSITTFIINRLLQQALLTQQPFYAGYGEGGTGYGGGALGPGGIIEDHYPPRDARNVPRNTFIIVKFYEPLKLNTVMNDPVPCQEGSDQMCGTINWSNILIFKTEDAGEQGAPPEDTSLLVQGGTMALTGDKKMLFFKPDPNLGNAVENTWYTVYLSSGLQKEDGSNVFGEYGFYAWAFEVGTYIDETPPRVSSVYPIDFDDPLFEFYANSIIQINFNEPVLPPLYTTTSGTQADTANSIYIEYQKANAVGYVEGVFNVGLNQFRSIEFIPTAECSELLGQEITNSCGEVPRCLPLDSIIRPYVKSSTVVNGQTQFPFDGIVDAAGNSLDGNADGVSQGPTEDDYPWEFLTGDDLDLEPPIIDSTDPGNAIGDIPVDYPVKADFNEGLSASYVNSKNVLLTDDWAKWYVSHLENVEGEPDENGQTYTTTNNDVIQISHGDFDKQPEVAEGEEELPPLKYYPIITHRVRDLQQNCYFPAQGPGCASPNPSCCPDPFFGIQESSPDPSCGY